MCLLLNEGYNQTMSLFFSIFYLSFCQLPLFHACPNLHPDQMFFRSFCLPGLCCGFQLPCRHSRDACRNQVRPSLTLHAIWGPYLKSAPDPSPAQSGFPKSGRNSNWMVFCSGAFQPQGKPPLPPRSPGFSQSLLSVSAVPE